jgi:hypothetical protein
MQAGRLEFAAWQRAGRPNARRERLLLGEQEQRPATCNSAGNLKEIVAG